MEKNKKENHKNLIDRRTFIKYTGMGSAAVVAAGFFPHIGVGKVPEIKIGQIYPFSGPLSTAAKFMGIGTMLGAEEINSKGGIKSLGGAKLTIVSGDSQAKPEVGMAEAERLIEGGCVVLTGCFQSSVTLAATEVAERFKTPFIVTIAIADEITRRGYKNVFRIEQDTSGIGKDTDEFIAWLEKTTGESIRTAVLIHENTLYGMSMADSLKRNLGKQSNLKVLKDISYPLTTKDLTTEVMVIKSLRPDIIIPTSYELDGILITRTIYDQRVDLKGIIGVASAGHMGPIPVKALGMIQEYVINILASMDRFHPRFDSILKNYKKKTGTTNIDPFFYYSYDGIQVIADALEKAGSTDKDKVRLAISKTEGVPALTASVPSTIKFDHTGQNVHAKFLATQCLGQKDTIVWPDKFKEKTIVFPMPKWKDRKI
jgi:branched-chain amino acid transport system substrate-binding protein